MAAAATPEYFDVYFMRLDDKIQYVIVYDQYRKKCYLGLYKEGKKLIVSAPFLAWRDVINDIWDKTSAQSPRYSHYDDVNGMNYATKPDFHCLIRFESLTVSQPISRLPAAIKDGLREDKLSTEELHQITFSYDIYKRFRGDLDFLGKLFRVLKAAKQPTLASDTNTIAPEFSFVFMSPDELWEYHVAIVPRRFTELNNPRIMIIQHSPDNSRPDIAIRLSPGYLHSISAFNKEKVLENGYGKHVVKDHVGNVILPEICVYPLLGDMPEDGWPTEIGKALCFNQDEWLFFMKVLDMFKAWYQISHGFTYYWKNPVENG